MNLQTDVYAIRDFYRLLANASEGQLARMAGEYERRFMAIRGPELEAKYGDAKPRHPGHGWPVYIYPGEQIEVHGPDLPPDVIGHLEMTDEQTKRIAQLRELIPQYKQHECSYDEHEAGCPVCNDIDCFDPTTVAVPNICYPTEEYQRKYALKYAYTEVQEAR